MNFPKPFYSLVCVICILTYFNPCTASHPFMFNFVHMFSKVKLPPVLEDSVPDLTYQGEGTSILGGRGLGPHIKFGGKIWGKVPPSSPNKRKNVGSSVTTRRKSWEKIPILRSNLKFRRVFVTYIFGGKIWGSNKNFRDKFWGQAPPPRPPNMKVPPPESDMYLGNI